MIVLYLHSDNGKLFGKFLYEEKNYGLLAMKTFVLEELVVF